MIKFELGCWDLVDNYCRNFRVWGFRKPISNFKFEKWFSGPSFFNIVPNVICVCFSTKIVPDFVFVRNVFKFNLFEFRSKFLGRSSTALRWHAPSFAIG